MEQVQQKTAILLAGGDSTRVGTDKALLEIYGETLLEMTYYGLRKFFEKIFIVVNSERQRWAYEKILHEDILVDLRKGFGPVSGLETGLKFCNSDYVFVAACDMPLINKKVVEFLYSKAAEKKYNAVVPMYANGNIEPLHAFYKVNTTRQAVEKALDDEKFRCRDFLSNMPEVLYVPVGEFIELDPKLETFFNVNTEVDLQNLKDGLQKKIYKGRIKKAVKLEPEIIKEVETEGTVYFRAPGIGETHEVRFNKRNNIWSCDCKYFSMKGNYCSHIIAAKNKFKI